MRTHMYYIVHAYLFYLFLNIKILSKYFSNPTIQSKAHFGNGLCEVSITNLGCKGNELEINQFNYTGLGHTICDHSQDVGVSCGKYCI